MADADALQLGLHVDLAHELVFLGHLVAGKGVGLAIGFQLLLAALLRRHYFVRFHVRVFFLLLRDLLKRCIIQLPVDLLDFEVTLILAIVE